MDGQAAAISEAKEASIASRKNLTEQTKNFKKMPDLEKLATFGNILKSYQVEVDRLTSRANRGLSAEMVQNMARLA